MSDLSGGCVINFVSASRLYMSNNHSKRTSLYLALACERPLACFRTYHSIGRLYQMHQLSS